ncbi:MAG TPA: peptidylprolyl isomerase [Capillibacterium sp.]
MKLKTTKIKRNVVIGILILVLLSGLVLGVRQWTATSQPAVVAKVNGEAITKNELYDLLLERAGQEGLNLLLAQKIVDLEAKKQKITITDQEIEEELADYYAAYGDAETLDQALALSGSSLARLKANLAHTLKVKKLLASRIAVTEAEMKAFFEKNKEDFAQEEQVKASHILVETEKEAKELKSRLEKGEDFAKLAKEYSKDTTTKEKGGDLGYFGRGIMDEAFEKAAFALKAGEISGPVQTEYGYHLIKVEAKKAAEAPNFEKNKEEIKEYLFNQKLQAEYNPWLQEVAADYKIETFLNAAK